MRDFYAEALKSLQEWRTERCFYCGSGPHDICYCRQAFEIGKSAGAAAREAELLDLLRANPNAFVDEMIAAIESGAHRTARSTGEGSDG